MGCTGGKPMKLTSVINNTLTPNTMTYTKASYFTCAVERALFIIIPKF